MKAFTNTNARDVAHALTLVRQAKHDGRSVAIAGGGSDLLALMKERLVTPDVMVSLKSIKGLDQIKEDRTGVTIGALATLGTIANHPLIKNKFTVLADAAGGVATPQIRNVATLAGNLLQRPWCWYYRNGFKCLKNGGNVCYSVSGENEYHAIFGGGPSYIVHPSDTAPALVALDAKIRLAGSGGERVINASDFFTLPTVDAARENVLKDDEVVTAVVIPAPAAGARSAYHKVMDREAWTHAVVSAAVVLDMANDVCRGARIVLGGVAPIPWRVLDVEKLLAGQRITTELAARAGAIAVAGARPLAKNGYKIPMTKALVERAIAERGLRNAD